MQPSHNGQISSVDAPASHPLPVPPSPINPNGQDIFSRINTPPNYKRIPADSGSFAFYLRHSPLKEHGTKVHHYNGTEKLNAAVYVAVLDIAVGNKDLQQCADAVIRLRGEYCFNQKLYDKIHYNFTNGFKADYIKWAEGYRIKINDNHTTWYLAAAPSCSYATFKQYLEIVFSYAGTLSLSKELIYVAIDKMRIGDIFIQGGNPGHAVIVVDMAESIQDGSKIFLIAQSYMPAQDIHVLANINDTDLSPWYDMNTAEQLYSPEWTFNKKDLKRFND